MRAPDALDRARHHDWEMLGTEPMRSSDGVPRPIFEMISVRSSTFL